MLLRLVTGRIRWIDEPNLLLVIYSMEPVTRAALRDSMCSGILARLMFGRRVDWRLTELERKGLIERTRGLRAPYYYVTTGGGRNALRVQQQMAAQA